MIAALASVVLQFGAPGIEQPLYAGTFVFGGIGLVLAYFVFVNEQVPTTRVLRNLMVVMFTLAILSLFWPFRP